MKFKTEIKAIQQQMVEAKMNECVNALKEVKLTLSPTLNSKDC